MSKTSTSESHIVRVRTLDEEGSFVLLHVSNNGSAQLDLRIAGTEGSAPFTGTVKQSRIHTLRDRKYKGDNDEWEAALCTSLLHLPLAEEHAKGLEGLETVAAVEGDQRVHIIIRKNIEGITQRLGAVTLDRDDDCEVGLFDWTGIAAQESEFLRQQLTDLQNKYDSQRKDIERLYKQLYELVQAKKDHEAALLEKFAALLNSKKLKIRDQQRLLAGAKVDRKAAAQIRDARDGTNTRIAGASRTSKRKATDDTALEESESEGFDDIPADDEADEEDRGRLETPDKSDLDATDDDEADDFNDIATRRPAQPGVGAKGKALESVAKDGEESDEEPPPQRDLPFNLKNGPSKAAQKSEEASHKAGKAQDDEETDDDEL